MSANAANYVSDVEVSHCADDGASQIMSDPNGWLFSEVIVELDHVLNDLAQGVSLAGLAGADEAPYPRMSGATQCQPCAANASTCARHMSPSPGQPWTKIIIGPWAGPSLQ